MMQSMLSPDHLLLKLRPTIMIRIVLMVELYAMWPPGGHSPKLTSGGLTKSETSHLSKDDADRGLKEQYLKSGGVVTSAVGADVNLM
jgi:uncharacterized protein YaiL (DUF2058 family)